MFAAYLVSSYQFLFQNTFSFKYPSILTGKQRFHIQIANATAGEEKANCLVHHKTKIIAGIIMCLKMSLDIEFL